jgi:hypothetical protein
MMGQTGLARSLLITSPVGAQPIRPNHTERFQRNWIFIQDGLEPLKFISTSIASNLNFYKKCGIKILQ